MYIYSCLVKSTHLPETLAYMTIRKNLSSLLFGASVFGTLVLGAAAGPATVLAAATPTVPSSAQLTSGMDGELVASGAAYEVVRLTCPTSRDTYHISIVQDDQYLYYRSEGLNISTRNEPGLLDKVSFFNNDFEYEVINSYGNTTQGTAVVNVYKYNSRILQLNCEAAYPARR